ncbi:MAG: polysaccharide biosynthesis/export family protein, partial [Verrucomicrobiota bacterium]
MKSSVRFSLFLLFSSFLASVSLAQGSGSPVGSNYILQPLDVIQLSVFQEPDLEQQARVSGDGSITLP